MSSLLTDYEVAALPELAPQFEDEWETEFAGDQEAEEFFGQLARMGATWLGGQMRRPGSPLRKAALGAARQVIKRGSPMVGSYVGRRAGNWAAPRLQQAGIAVNPDTIGNLGDASGRFLASQAGDWLSGLLPDQEFEGEWEFEDEVGSPGRGYTAAMMEHLGHAAANAESEAEAEAFIGALIPLAARLLPRAASTVMRAAPNLIKGLAGATKTLRSDPATRPLVRTLPSVMRRTAMDIARRRARGQRITPQTAVRTLAKQTAQVVGNPRTAVQAYRRSKALDRRLHASTPTLGPVPQPSLDQACRNSGNNAIPTTAAETA